MACRSQTIEIHGGCRLYSVFFMDNDEQVWSGGDEGMIRRWQIDGCHDVGEGIQAGCQIWTAALSPDGKWLVCGLKRSQQNVGVWDARTGQKVLSVGDHGSYVWSVDISRDSTKFATSGGDKFVYVWSMATGERLLGPLVGGSAVAVRFSPDGDQLAVASVTSIRVFDGNSGQKLLDIHCPFPSWSSTPLTWSEDSRKLVVVTFNEAKSFDASSGALLDEWPVPGGQYSTSIVLSHNQKFFAIVANNALSFWDASTRTQIGSVIVQSSTIWSVALSSSDDRIATGEDNAKITVRSLRGILPESYFEGDVSSSRLSQLPLIKGGHATLQAWTRGDLSRAEQLLIDEIQHPGDLTSHAHALAHRALIHSRLKQYDLAIDDAKKSVQVQWSTIGQVAIAIARAGDGELDAALRVFDLAFTNGSSAENHLLLLIKAIISFECGKHQEAILRVEDLIDIVEDKSTCVAVQAQMYLLLGTISLRQSDYERAAELLDIAAKATPRTTSPQLVVISLIFGWDFDGLAPTIQLHLQQCTKALEEMGDAAIQSENPEQALARYSAALSLNPSVSGLLVKRSKAQAVLSLWDNALKDADAAIGADPNNLWGYERRYVALHALQHRDDADETLDDMLSLLEESLNPDIQRGHNYGDDGFGHVLQDIITLSGEEAVFAWTGASSSYNSALPSSFSVCHQLAHSPTMVQDAERDAHVAALRGSVSPSDAMLILDRVTRLPPVRFAHRRLYLPSIMFPVKRMVENRVENRVESGQDNCYSARVSGIGHVEFRTSDRLPLTDPRKLVFVHPWIRDLRGPLNQSGWGSGSDSDEANTDWVTVSDSTPTIVPSDDVPATTVDGYTRALQLIDRLQQPFRVLLLQQQPYGGYKRIAAEHEIVVPGLEQREINFARDIRTEIIEIL